MLNVMKCVYVQACVEETQRSWASLLEASHCMRVHLENAARYQQVSIVGRLRGGCLHDHCSDNIHEIADNIVALRLG